MIPGPADGGWRAWLEDRSFHRAPIDRHFEQALVWMLAEDASAVRAPGLKRVLELGPGPQTDLQMALASARIAYTSADLNVPSGRRDIVDLLIVGFLV